MKDPAHQWAVFDQHLRVHLHVLAESDPGQDDDQPMTRDQLARLYQQRGGPLVTVGDVDAVVMNRRPVERNSRCCTAQSVIVWA
jgi:hypothetical protein